MNTNSHAPSGTAASYRDAPGRSITADGAGYAYRELGPKGGVPVIFLVHLAATLDSWDPRVVDPIARDHHVITFDNRGVGASTGQVPGSVEEMAQDAYSFIKALGFDTVDVFALSLGGMVAQSLADMHPELVRKLILMGTGPKGGKSTDRVTPTTYLDMARAALSRSDPKEYLFFTRDADGKRAAKEFVKRLQERTADRDAPISFKAFQAQLKAIKNWGRAAPMDLAMITQPTLIANGDNDRMVPTRFSEDLHRRISGSELVIYPGASHGSIFQFHEQFTSAAIEFLDRPPVNKNLTLGGR
ncbi:MAG: alpha/beta hydrolase [Paeniglutamicibacter sp.]